jgi:hypothetical protein
MTEPRDYGLQPYATFPFRRFGYFGGDGHSALLSTLAISLAITSRYPSAIGTAPLIAFASNNSK